MPSANRMTTPVAVDEAEIEGRAESWLAQLALMLVTGQPGPGGGPGW